MNSFSGKLIAKVFLAAVAAGPLFGLIAADSVVFFDDFEDRLPGQSPLQWRKIWGDPKEDRMAISNESAASGKRSLFFEHSASNQGQWGWGMTLPPLKRGILELSYRFRLDGSRGQVRLSFDLRDRKNRPRALLFWSIENMRFSASSTDPKAAFPGGVLDQLESDCWYGVRVRYPITSADGETATVELIPPGATQGKSMQVSVFHPEELELFQINIMPRSPDFGVFIDEVRVTVPTEVELGTPEAALKLENAELKETNGTIPGWEIVGKKNDEQVSTEPFGESGKNAVVLAAGKQKTDWLNLVQQSVRVNALPALSPGKSLLFKFSAMAKLENVDGHAILSIIFFDAQGKRLLVFDKSAGKGTLKWHEESLVAEVPAIPEGADSVGVCFFLGQSNGKVMYADPKLEVTLK